VELASRFAIKVAFPHCSPVTPNADIVTPFWLIQQTCRLVPVRTTGGCRQVIDTAGRLRTFLAMNPTMTTTHPVGDPRHTFLKPQEVIARFRWGRTRGYLELKKPGFPRPIAGNYRLDTLIAWEDRCLAGRRTREGRDHRHDPAGRAGHGAGAERRPRHDDDARQACGASPA